MSVTVQDSKGRTLSPCSLERAESLVATGTAEWVTASPAVIRLHRAVQLPTVSPPEPHPLSGRKTLLHICCGPCATFTVNTLRAAGAVLTGYWYNPNIHPYSEHERRRESLARFAEQVDLPMIWHPGYEMTAFFHAVHGQEQFGLRCRACYRLRLESTARVAAQQGFEAFSTTLLISPYQDIESIRLIGDELATRYGVSFYWENLRRGFKQHHQLAQDYGLYRQQYCGCVYSEWEALDRDAPTGRRNTPRRDMPQPGLQGRG